MKKKCRFEVIKGDITSLEVDAIVNAANNSLLGGGGVDRAIHKAAGPELYEECLNLDGCATGESKITKGYRLASCYQTSLKLAYQHKIKTIAFPGISTGAYRFPKDLAALIAVNETKRFVSKNNYPEKVIFVAFDQENYEIYRKLLEK